MKCIAMKYIAMKYIAIYDIGVCWRIFDPHAFCKGIVTCRECINSDAKCGVCNIDCPGRHWRLDQLWHSHHRWRL